MDIPRPNPRPRGLLYRALGRLFDFINPAYLAILVWLIGFVLTIGFWTIVIAVAWHFISKYW